MELSKSHKAFLLLAVYRSLLHNPALFVITPGIKHHEPPSSDQCQPWTWRSSEVLLVFHPIAHPVPL
jgi:hypothetical protein